MAYLELYIGVLIVEDEYSGEIQSSGKSYF